MRRTIINLKKVESTADLYNIIETKLRTPEYFGRNLDALHDILTDMSGTVEFRSFGKAKAALGEYGDSLEEMLRAASAESERIEIILKD